MTFGTRNTNALVAVMARQKVREATEASVPIITLFLVLLLQLAAIALVGRTDEGYEKAGAAAVVYVRVRVRWCNGCWCLKIFRSLLVPNSQQGCNKRTRLTL